MYIHIYISKSQVANIITGNCDISMCLGIPGGVVSGDPCSPNPCHNGGTCAWEGQDESYTCSCPEDYTGQNCDSKTFRIMSI